MGADAARLRQAYDKGYKLGKVYLDGEGSTPAGFSLRYWRDNARCLAELIGWPTDELVAKVMAYHRERLDAVPDLTVYPELRGYRDVLEQEEKGLRDAGIPDSHIALTRTFDFWRDTRLIQETGKAHFTMALPEKCRVLYLAESDEGALHFKNVDDPLTYWAPRARHEPNAHWPFPHPLMYDGVGSGLHIDEMPPEIFPVDAITLSQELCSTVEAATDFLVRYNYFWGGGNLLIHDYAGNSMAFEKTRCRVAARKGNTQGINFITGMGALDPDLAAFQKQQRQKYLDQQNWGWDDSADGCYFQTCSRQWQNMARYVDELSLNPTYANAKQVMEQRDPSGPMCVNGEKSHPGQEPAGHTLVMDCYFIDQKKLHRRQRRDKIPVQLDTPEIVHFV